MRVIECCFFGILSTLSGGVALAQTIDPHTPVAVWPTPEGFEVRVQQQVIELDSSGTVLRQSTNQVRTLDSEPLRLVLPESGGLDAVAVLDASDSANGLGCERVDAGGGRMVQVVRIASLSSERKPPVARDRDGLIYANSLSFRGSSLRQHVRVYAPDCHLLGRIELDANYVVEGLAASVSQGGVWVYVRRGGSASMRRYVGFQLERAFEIEGGLGQVSSMAVSPDGALLAAAHRFDLPTKLSLHRFDPSNPGNDFQSMFFGGEQSYGFAFDDGHIIHAARVRDGNFNQFLELLEFDAQLRVGEFGYTQIADVSGLRRVADQAEGMQGNAWAIERGLASATCCQVLVGRLRRGPSLEVLSPTAAGRPALLVGSDGSVIRGGVESGRLRLYRSSAGADSVPFATELEGLALTASSYQTVAIGPVNPSLPGGAGSLVLSINDELAFASAFDQEGHQRWQTRLGDPSRVAKWLTPTNSEAPACVAMSKGLLAFTHQTPIGVDVVCLHPLTGRAAPPKRVAQADSLQLVGGNVATHGALVLYHIQPERAGIAEQPAAIVQTLLSPGGSPQQRLFVSPAFNPDAAPLRVTEGTAGRFLFADDSTGSLLLRQFSSDGTELASRALPGFRARPMVLAEDASGRVLLVGPATGDGDQLVSINANGQEDWRVSLQSLAPGIDNLRERFANAQAYLDPVRGLWLLLVFAEDGRDRLFVIDPATGQSVADLALPVTESNARTREAAFSLDPVSGDVTLARRHGRSLEFRRIDAARGRLGAATIQTLPGLRRDWYLQDGQMSMAFAPGATDAQPAQVRRYSAPELAADQPISVAHAGLWFDPQNSGQGLLIDVNAEQGYAFGAWFTFAQDAVGQRESLRWYSMLSRDASARLTVGAELFQTRGGDLSGAQVPQTDSVGVAGLRAIDCNTLEFAYAIPDADGASPPVLTGARRLQRLGPPPAACGGTSLAEQSGLRAASTGSWVLEGRPNQGLLMQVDPGATGAAGAVWGAWFGFDAGEVDDALAQHWLTVVGRSAAGQSGVVELEWMRTLGGSFDAQPTRNTTVIGSGRLRFTACDRAVLEYSFDAPGLPGDAFAGLQGEVALRRFEPCR